MTAGSPAERSLAIKSKVLKKVVSYTQKCRSAGKNVAVRGFQISYRSTCNFRCSHCYVASSSTGTPDTLTLDDVKRVADEFDELNAWEVGIQGGEPLLFPDLEELIAAVDPARFYVCLITNGYLMTDAKAEQLARLGVDRVAVSIDGFSEAEHDSLRNKRGSFRRCLKALECVKQAGMTPAINMVIGHYNVRSEKFLEFVEFAQTNRYQIVVNPATPTGSWRGNYEIMLTDEDSELLSTLKKEHHVIMRDLWDFSVNNRAEVWGDTSGNLFYISSRGDIFPHPYIFIKLGNVKTDPVREAVKKGWKVRYFRDKSHKTLAGEDCEFVKKFLSHDMSVLMPMPFEKAFSAEDLYPSGEDEIIRISSANDTLGGTVNGTAPCRNSQRNTAG